LEEGMKKVWVLLDMSAMAVCEQLNKMGAKNLDLTVVSCTTYQYENETWLTLLLFYREPEC
jgi:hypothetical protein